MIEIRNLSKSFDDHKVLDHVSLTIQTGETMVIIVRSGCGKSVLLKHISGLMKPDEGAVVIDGADLTQLSGRELDTVRLKFGMLFQGAALFDSMTVYENVAFPLQEHATMTPHRLRRRAHSAFKPCGKNARRTISARKRCSVDEGA